MGLFSISDKIIWFVLISIAYRTKPDLDSFRKYLSKQIQDTGSTWLEGRLVSEVMSRLLVKYHDYRIFSVASIPRTPEIDEILSSRTHRPTLTYLGVYGSWFPIPSFAIVRRVISNAVDRLGFD